MAEFLVFTLAAPLMAFGDVAPGERRVSAQRPGRSALIGLVAAALGLRRDDPRQPALAAGLALAVRVDAAGHALVDYHTTQAPPARRNRRFATRREELAVADIGTILSQRTYVADSAFTVAALAVAPGPFELATIAAALARPLLPIHAGRRACPLGLPPGAAVIEAPTLPEALALYDAREAADVDRAELRHHFGLAPGGPSILALDEDFEQQGLLGTARIHRREIRRDQPADRLRWQFSPRTEIVAHLAERPAAAGAP